MNRAPIMIACLARIAWADGKLLPREAEFFREVIEGLKLPPSEALRAWRAVVCPPLDLDQTQAALLSREDRLLVLALSEEMAMADGEMSDEEREALQQLRQTLPT